MPVHAGFEQTALADPEALPTVAEATGPNDTLTLDLVIPALKAAGLEPLPEQGASDEAVEAWVERFIDASARPALQEADHAR